MTDLSEPLRLLSLSLLGGWFLLTLVRQIDHPRVEKPFARLDPFELIPAWRLFDRAPSDCRLWLRDRDRQGTPGPWRAMPYACGPSLIIWSPGFRPAAYLNILVQGLLRHLSRRPGWCSVVAPWGQMSSFYPPIENHLRHLPAERHLAERQFAITVADAVPGEDGSEAYYVSPFFDIPRRGGAAAEEDREPLQEERRNASRPSSAESGSQR